MILFTHERQFGGFEPYFHERDTVSCYAAARYSVFWDVVIADTQDFPNQSLVYLVSNVNHCHGLL